MTVDAHDRHPKGNVLTVKFAAVNNGSGAAEWPSGSPEMMSATRSMRTVATSTTSSTDKEGNPVASAKDWMPNSTAGINREIAPGKSLRVWMKLPAPPPEVAIISLFLNETDPIEDVPITDL